MLVFVEPLKLIAASIRLDKLEHPNGAVLAEAPRHLKRVWPYCVEVSEFRLSVTKSEPLSSSLSD